MAGERGRRDAGTSCQQARIELDDASGCGNLGQGAHNWTHTDPIGCTLLEFETMNRPSNAKEPATP